MPLSRYLNQNKPKNALFFGKNYKNRPALVSGGWELCSQTPMLQTETLQLPQLTILTLEKMQK